MTAYNPAPEELYPMLRADNTEVLIHPSDRKYGALLVGGQGTGKCIGADELVLLDGRLLRAEDAWERYSTLAVFDGEGWWSKPSQEPVSCALAENGRIVPAQVRRLYRQHVRERLRRVRLSDGSELTITRRHRLRGPDEWTSELRTGATVCVPRYLDWPSPEATDLRTLGEAIAWQLAAGREYGVANPGRRGASRLEITHEDLATIEDVRALFLTVGELWNAPIENARIEHGRSRHTLSVESDGWREFLVRRGYRWKAPRRERALPDFIMCGDVETSRVIARVFANARSRLYETDGRVEIATGSRMLAEQLRIVFRRFGILASFAPTRRPATGSSRIERDYTRLAISGESLHWFALEIGFADQHRDQQLQQLLADSCPDCDAIDIQDVLGFLQDLGIPPEALTPPPGDHARPHSARPRPPRS
jgi:LAGLIDADG-like domain